MNDAKGLHAYQAAGEEIADNEISEIVQTDTVLRLNRWQTWIFAAFFLQTFFTILPSAAAEITAGKTKKAQKFSSGQKVKEEPFLIALDSTPLGSRIGYNFGIFTKPGFHQNKSVDSTTLAITNDIIPELVRVSPWWHVFFPEEEATCELLAPPSTPAEAPTSEKLDHLIIASRIAGKKEASIKLLQFIKTARDQSDSEEIGDYIDLVIKYLPELQIIPMTKQYFSNFYRKPLQTGRFDNYFLELGVVLDIRVPDRETISYLIHGFFHAFRALNNKVLADDHCHSSSLAPTEAQLYKQRWDVADIRIDKMAADVNLLGELSQIKNPDSATRRQIKRLKKKMGRIRSQLSDLTNNSLPFFSTPLDIKLPSPAIEFLTSRGIKLQKGKIINVDGLFTIHRLIKAYGNLKITDIAKNTDGSLIVSADAQDPIVKFLLRYYSLLKTLENSYSSTEWIMQRPAFVRAFFPEQTIKAMWPEIYAYDKSLRMKIREKLSQTTPIIYLDRAYRYAKIAERYKTCEIDRLHGKIIKATAKKYYDYADLLVKGNKLLEAEQTLKEIIKQNCLLKACNELLGQIYFRQKNYPFVIKQYNLSTQGFFQKSFIGALNGYSLGVSLLKLKQYPITVEILTLTLDRMKKDPTISDPLVKLCEEHLKKAQLLASQSLTLINPDIFYEMERNASYSSGLMG